MQRVMDILNEWIDAVNAKELAKILSLYDKTAVLIPTFSNRILNSTEKVSGYFEALSGRNGLKVELHPKTIIVQKITGETFSVSGIYCWRFEVDDEPLSFEARFTYIINAASKSPILHHHSSQIPRTL